jgi:hypothetical protein
MNIMEDEDDNFKCCKRCRFFSAYLYDLDMDIDSDHLVSDYGECRRYPPKVISEDACVFPIVQDSEWCGEFDI